MTLNRRDFAQKLALSPIFLGYSALNIEFSGKSRLPKKLSKGDVVGLISPSGAVFNNEPTDIAIEALENFGLRVKASKYLRGRYGHLAGTDEQRASEINEMFADDTISGIVCLRGGSGAARILNLLNYSTIKSNPKVFIGYSDITALQLAFYKKAGLISFHGPVGLSKWSQFSREYFNKLLFNNERVTFQNPPKPDDAWVQTQNRIRVINPGTASGKLLGGNLSVLCGLIGSEFLPDFKGSILFVEEVNEALYRVDRLMSQLQLSGILDSISGFIFGQCTNCNPDQGYGSLTFDEIIDHYIQPLGVPAFSGSMIGHIDDKFTLPIGVKAEMDADLGIFKLLEHALED